MFMKIGLMPIIAAASMALAGCGQNSNQASANNAAATEANAAQANSAGQSSSGGAPTGAMCGGIAGIQCASARDFCRMATGQCNVPDASGTCAPRPEICTREYRPVCGCNGRTYGNACEAAAAGINVQAQGECPAAGAGEGNSTTAR